jgi:thioredoxin-related protein
MRSIPTWSRLIVIAALTGAILAAGLIASDLRSANATTNDSSIQTNPVALGEHVTKHPNKLGIVLVSTPGCGFCQLVRERQLTPLLKDPDFKDVAVFEVMMRDPTKFKSPVMQFRSHTGADLGKISSAAELSKKLNINFAPTVLFIGGSAELAERLVGYGVPDYYFAYLSERIDTARQNIANLKQK